MARRAIRSSRRPGVATRMSVPFSSLQLLLVDRRAADYGVDLHRRTAHVALQAGGDLVDQFAGRSEDERTGGAVVRTLRVLGQHFDDRETESCRFARAGLGKADHVAAFEKLRDRLFLDRGRRFVTKRKKSGYDLLGQAKLVEIRQVEYLFGAPKAYAGLAPCRPVCLWRQEPRVKWELASWKLLSSA